LTEREAHADLRAFESDLAGGVFHRLAHPEAAHAGAIVLSRKHTATLGCRSLDILHVAAALALEADAFHTFDRRQQRLARAEGLKTPVSIRP